MNRQIDYMINLKLYREWDSLDESTKKLYEGIHKMNRQGNYMKGFIK
jgi:hypothetical protein